MTAAKQCFTEKGFHCASISDIAALAGMSTGHLYHYFSSKDEIVAAIAEAELAAVLEHWSAFGAGNVVEAIAARVADAALYCARAENARLRVEIAAESARNPRIGELVEKLDQQARNSIYPVLATAMCEAGNRSCENRMDMTYDLLSAIAAGFSLRGMRWVIADEQQLRAQIAEVVRVILKSDGEGAA